MYTITLNTSVTTEPDFSGFNFYVQSGEVFDADAFAEAYGLNRHDLDADDVHAAQDKSAGLLDGQWMLVEYEA